GGLLGLRHYLWTAGGLASLGRAPAAIPPISKACGQAPHKRIPTTTSTHENPSPPQARHAWPKDRPAPPPFEPKRAFHTIHQYFHRVEDKQLAPSVLRSALLASAPLKLNPSPRRRAISVGRSEEDAMKADIHPDYHPVVF